MAVETGITDEINLINSSSTDITDELGVITSASHTIRQPVEQRPSIGQGIKPQANLEGVAELQTSIEFQPSKLDILKLFGSYTDNNDGTYTVTLDDTLPTFDVKHEKVDGGGTVTINNVKFGSFTLQASDGQPVSISISGRGDDFQYDNTETITTPSIRGSPRQWFDAEVQIDSTTVGSVESISIDHNRNLRQFKGIEDDASGEKRLPTQILEAGFDLSFNIVINIENNRAYEEALDDTSSPLQIQDSRSNKKVQVVMDTSAGTDTFELSGVLADEVSAEMQNDGDKRTATLTGVAQDGQIDGDI